MRIMLDEKYGIKSYDDNNIVLFEIVEREKKETKEKYLDDKTLGYYGDIKQGLLGYLKYGLKHSDYNRVYDITTKIDELERNIWSSKLIKGI